MSSITLSTATDYLCEHRMLIGIVTTRFLTIYLFVYMTPRAKSVKNPCYSSVVLEAISVLLSYFLLFSTDFFRDFT